MDNPEKTGNIGQIKHKTKKNKTKQKHDTICAGHH